MNIKVGTVVELKIDCMQNPKGTLGVCYEHYRLDRQHEGWSIIFENGAYDGFGNWECDRFLEVTGFCQELSNYQFKNVMKLSNDFSLGVFDIALKNTT